MTFTKNDMTTVTAGHAGLKSELINGSKWQSCTTKSRRVQFFPTAVVTSIEASPEANAVTRFTDTIA